MNDGQAKLARRFRGQADSCTELGSPLYGELLARGAEDVAAGGPVWRACASIAHLPGGAIAPLRFMGGTHRLALSGEAPELAACYPSCGGSGSADAAWAALTALADSVAGDSRWDATLRRGIQTNEVGRAGALLGGFLAFARAARMPLRLLEVGASAGLNLQWDRFRYGTRWGPPDSLVDVGDPWTDGRHPDLTPAAVEVASRRGCDIAPLDPATDDGRLTLLSFVWPDMRARFAMLDGACRLAAASPMTVDRMAADEWLAAHLASTQDGVATVVYHSVFLQYVEASARARLLATIADAGARATARSPLAWLRLEPPGALGPSEFEVRLTTWPGGADVQLAVCHPHGVWVRWLA